MEKSNNIFLDRESQMTITRKMYIYKCGDCGIEFKPIPIKRAPERSCKNCNHLASVKRLLENKDNVIGKSFSIGKVVNVDEHFAYFEGGKVEKLKGSVLSVLLIGSRTSTNKPRLVFGYAEAAKKLGVSRQAVWTRISRAKDKEKIKQEIYDKTGIRIG
jgi:DNA-directed RNA polymerase subunit RPC12/RpoP